jgi:hypothetical protein
MSFIGELQSKAGLQALKSHYVPSWVKTIFFKPISPAETNRIVAMGKPTDSNAALWCRYVVMKSLDEDKVRIFTNDDFQALMELPYQHEIEELYLKMKEVASVEDAGDDFMIIPA